MIDRLARLLGFGSMTADLEARMERAEAEAGKVNERVAAVEAIMDDFEATLEMHRERPGRRRDRPA